MGVYFEYDFKNGKEVEKTENCYLCKKGSVLFAEYYILDGNTYKLYKESRKIVKGKEIPVGSRLHLVCEACFQESHNEESLVEKILTERLNERKEQYENELNELKALMEKKTQEISLKEKELEVLRQELSEIKDKSESILKLLGGAIT